MFKLFRVSKVIIYTGFMAVKAYVYGMKSIRLWDEGYTFMGRKVCVYGIGYSGGIRLWDRWVYVCGIGFSQGLKSAGQPARD